jgi:hypothetical protein
MLAAGLQAPARQGVQGMKINVTVDCTPKELREFLGWPDVEPLQREMLERVSQMMQEGVTGADPMSLMRPFLAPNTQAFEAMQKAFMQAFQPGTTGRDRAKKD